MVPAGTFPRAARLTTPAAFRAALTTGIRRRSSTCELIWLARLGPARLGMIVARGVGTAVARNRLKRVVRDWFRGTRTELTGDWIIRCLPAATARSTREIREDLTRVAQSVRKRAS